jgi:hypothetical protein
MGVRRHARVFGAGSWHACPENAPRGLSQPRALAADEAEMAAIDRVVKLFGFAAIIGMFAWSKPAVSTSSAQ